MEKVGSEADCDCAMTRGLELSKVWRGDCSTPPQGVLKGEKLLTSRDQSQQKDTSGDGHGHHGQTAYTDECEGSDHRGGSFGDL